MKWYVATHLGNTKFIPVTNWKRDLQIDLYFPELKYLRKDAQVALFRVFASKREAAEVKARLKQEELRMLMEMVPNANRKGFDSPQEWYIQTLGPIFREARSDSTVDLMVRMKDEEALTRWIAIEIAKQRWDKTETPLIELLEDPVPLVRQSAHQALVQLSRGNDFGPAGPNPNRDQVRAAQKQWRGWLELQDR